MDIIMIVLLLAELFILMRNIASRAEMNRLKEEAVVVHVDQRMGKSMPNSVRDSGCGHSRIDWFFYRAGGNSHAGRRTFQLAGTGACFRFFCDRAVYAT